MPYQGVKLSISDLLALSRASEPPQFDAGIGVLHTAAHSAQRAKELITTGDSLDDVWRYGILQTLDDYTSTVRRGGTVLGSNVFAEAPELTGISQIDAGFAALADYLSEKDGWARPEWASEPARTTRDWFPDVPPQFRADAIAESPRAFRDRGIWITSRTMARA
jgi:hypothetical protein